MNIKVDVERSDYLECGAVKKYLKETHLDCVTEVANAKEIGWKNDESTLVLRLILGQSVDFDDGIKIAHLAWQFGVDRFDSMTEDYMTFYRFWWD